MDEARELLTRLFSEFIPLLAEFFHKRVHRVILTKTLFIKIYGTGKWMPITICNKKRTLNQENKEWKKGITISE